LSKFLRLQLGADINTIRLNTAPGVFTKNAGFGFGFEIKKIPFSSYSLFQLYPSLQANMAIWKHSPETPTPLESKAKQVLGSQLDLGLVMLFLSETSRIKPFVGLYFGYQTLFDREGDDPFKFWEMSPAMGVRILLIRKWRLSADLMLKYTHPLEQPDPQRGYVDPSIQVQTKLNIATF
jgi:hypothetical protein